MKLCIHQTVYGNKLKKKNRGIPCIVIGAFAIISYFNLYFYLWSLNRSIAQACPSLFLFSFFFCFFFFFHYHSHKFIIAHPKRNIFCFILYSCFFTINSFNVSEGRAFHLQLVIVAPISMRTLRLYYSCQISKFSQKGFLNNSVEMLQQNYQK